VVARHRAGHVRAMILRVPLRVADPAGALAGPQEVDRHHLALRHVDHGAAIAFIARGRAEPRIAEVAHVRIDPRIHDPDDLALSVDALGEDRRAHVAVQTGLPYPDR